MSKLDLIVDDMSLEFSAHPKLDSNLSSSLKLETAKSQFVSFSEAFFFKRDLTNSG